MNSFGSLTVAERFVLTLEGLCRAVAARVAGGAMAEWMVLLVWQRVRRVERQVLGLLARFRAGRVGVRAVGRARGAVVLRASSSVRLPRRFGWLLPLVPCEAAGFASQLRALLAEPEMRALLDAVPQARRVLAPVCRMLALEPAVLGISPPVAVARGVGVKTVRSRVVPEPFRIPLPRGVVSAARREGFGRVR